MMLLTVRDGRKFPHPSAAHFQRPLLAARDGRDVSAVGAGDAEFPGCGEHRDEEQRELGGPLNQCVVYVGAAVLARTGPAGEGFVNSLEAKEKEHGGPFWWLVPVIRQQLPH